MAYANALDYYKGVTGQGEDSFLKLGSTGMDKWNNKYDSYLLNNGVSRGAKTRPQTNITAGLASYLTNSDTNVPTYGKNQPSLWDRAQATFTGTSPFKYETGVKDNRISYIDEYGNLATTGTLDGSTLDTAKDLYSNNNNIFGNASQTGTGIGGLASSIWDSVGGLKGFNDWATVFGTAYDFGDKLGWWGNSKEKEQTQIDLAKQNIAANQLRMDNYKKFHEGLARSGLAAKA